MSLAVCEKACFQTDKWTLCFVWVWLQKRDIPATDRLRHQMILLTFRHRASSTEDRRFAAL